MAALDGIQAAANELKSITSTLPGKIDAVAALVQALKDQIAAGSGVSQAEIDAVLASLAEAKVSTEAASVKIDAVLV